MVDTTKGAHDSAILKKINAEVAEVNYLSCANDFVGAERQLISLREIIAAAKFDKENTRRFANLRYHDCAGRHWNYRAVHAFIVEVDPIDSNTFSLRAIDHYEQALKYAQSINIGDTPQQNATEDNIVALSKANVDNARGMLSLSAGEIQLKSGQFTRAQTTLAEAYKNLTMAEEWFIADARKNNNQPDPGFSDVAKAFLEEANSEIALISGALGEAADAEKSRAEALESAAKKHAISDLSTSDYFSRRMKRDAEFAHARSQLFRDASEKLVTRPWFASYLFFVLAIGSAMALVYVMGNFELLDNPFTIGLIFTFVFVVAGVATRLGKWNEGAELLTSLTKSTRQDRSAD